jgi:hypothetical protein
MTVRPHAESSIRRSEGSASADVLEALQLLQRVAFLQSDLYSRALAVADFVSASDITVFTTLSTQENAHVTTLTALILARSPTPIARPVFDFTAKGALPGFAFATGQYVTFQLLAQAFEDLSVRAHKGQLQALLADKPALNAALAIHSVEGRHASEVRRLRGKKAWVTGNSRDDLPAFLQPIYDGEDNVTQGTVNVTAASSGFGGVDSASEAFDEPLTAGQVTTILQNFLP